MPSPLSGADDPRRCSGSTRAEVLAKFARYYEVKDQIPPETKEERNLRHCIWLAEKEESERIYQTSIRPFRKPAIDKFPEYIDPRLRDFRSRFGAVSND